MATIKTVKGTKQKLGAGSYGSYIPFGIDGQYADMFSGLDLEQELKIGGPEQIQIVQNEDGSFDIIQNIQTIDASENGYYKLTVNINEEATLITQKLYWVDAQGQNTLKRTKTISIIEEDIGFNIKGVLS